MSRITRSYIIELFGKFEGEMYDEKDDGKYTICLKSMCPYNENVSRGDTMPVYKIIKVETIARFVFLSDGKPDYFAIDEKGYSCTGILVPYTMESKSNIESDLLSFGFVKKKEVQMSLFSLF